MPYSCSHMPECGFVPLPRLFTRHFASCSGIVDVDPTTGNLRETIDNDEAKLLKDFLDSCQQKKCVHYFLTIHGSLTDVHELLVT